MREQSKMVKRMRKVKTTREVAMIAKKASTRVRTRAKTVGLKKSPSYRPTSTMIESTTITKDGDGCYLQLRSRRLEWRASPLAKKVKKNKWHSEGKDIDLRKKNGGINFVKELKDGEEIASKKIREREVVEKEGNEFGSEERNKNDEKDYFHEKDEGSFGENDLHFGNKESGRITMESPMSSNTATTNVNATKEMENEVPIMMSAEELEELFSKVEKEKIQKFIKKYNFDPVNEKPLNGRYEWVKFKD